MPEKRAVIRLSFSTKVLIPLIVTIVLLVSFALWILNARITRQFQADATQNLLTAQKIFANLEVMRARHLLLRTATTPNDPRFRAIAQLGETNTLRFFLMELTDELKCDFLSFRNPDGDVVTSISRDPHVDPLKWSGFGRTAATRAAQGDAIPDMDVIDNTIYRLAAIPVFIAENIVGILTIAEKVSDASAREFFNLTGCRVALFIDREPVLSTLQASDLTPLISLIEASAYAGHEIHPVTTTMLDQDHVLALHRPYERIDKEQPLYYALVLSYEQTLQALRHVQSLLLGAGLLSILISSVVIAIVIGRVTTPLRALRKSAEAVARGDFTQKVSVISSDETGDLAVAFNQMIDSLRHSTDELQTTITTLQSTRAQLMQSEKLSALGEFIAGVTHELNNPLCTIVGFSELLKEQNVGAKFNRDLDMIADAATRCHKIVQNLLSFSRQRAPERKTTGIHEIIDSTLNFMSYELRTSNIAVTREFDRNLPPIVADAHQLQQVFLNLINNARQAIVDSQKKGNIVIQTRSSGPHAVINIADDGPGIPPENLAKIFDPFFTTKEVGKGTGLGLSVSYGIIREHGGEISAESTVGKGTTFTIRLPLVYPGEVPVTPTSPLIQLDADPLLGEGRKVLVIDDEKDVIQLTTQILEANQFVVETATDGHEALRRMRHAWFDIILCDWRMPGMNGRSFYEELRTSNPAAATRLIFMTGDVLNEQTTTFLKDSGKHCINKPFSLEEFRRTIKQVIS